MKTLLVSFIYPSIKLFLKEFFNSLANQTTKEFDIIIFNDNFKENLLNYGYNGQIMYNQAKLNIVETRKLLINYSIDNKYDLLICADADDVMADDRVEAINKSYQDNISFFYNDLYLLSNQNVDFFKGKLPNKVENLEKIKEYNFLGMSHTALNIKKEKNNLRNIPISDKIIAFDWYLHSYLLSKGGCGKKISTKTYYRIYDKNIAGSCNNLTNEKLRTGLMVKKYHYDIMKQFNETYSKLLDKILKLEIKLKNPQFKKKYIKYINTHYSDSVFWWENIKTLDKIRGGDLSD